MFKFRYLFILLLFTSFLSQNSCNSKAKKEWISVSPDFIPYIQAYTGGIISTTSSIKIQLTQAAKIALAINDVVDNDLFQFEPSLNGKVKWLDSETVEFLPDAPLNMDEIYNAKFNLGKVSETPSSLQNFEFSFKTIRQSAKLLVDFLQTDASNSSQQYLTGSIQTADLVDSEVIKECLSARQGTTQLNISWEKDVTPNHYQFTILGIQRSSVLSDIHVNFSGKPINIEEEFNEKIEVVPSGVFQINSMRMMPGKDAIMEIHFSDPLNNTQLLQGLVKVYGTDKPDAVADGQVIRIFFPNNQTDQYTVELFPGIQSSAGKLLSEGKLFKSSKPSPNPDVRFPNNGSILPQTKGLNIPFEAIHLNKVDVKIIRILEDNIPRFLSSNQLQGNSGLRQTGKIVAVTTIDLKRPVLTKRGDYSGYSLNLDEIVKTEPGAIYRVELSYKHEYADLACLDNATSLEELKPNPDFRKLNQNSYYGYDDWYEEEDYDYDYSYNWRQRENPCDPSFYRYGRTAVSNFLATSIGLMAKEGKDDSWHFYTSNIIDGNQISNVQLNVLDYQLQPIATLTTDKDGYAQLSGDLNDTPFMVTASLGDQKSYLKLIRGEMRPVGSFDVSGESINEGIKAFLYTERGVWRPGDTVFLNSIIESQSEAMAAANQPPLVLSVFNSRGQKIHKEIKPYLKDKSLYGFSFNTQAGSPTGVYRAVLEFGSATFVKYLRVETIQPNRLKMALKFPDDIIRNSNSNIPIQINSSWLHGSPAAGLRANVTASLSDVTTEFKGFQGYAFDDITNSQFHDEITLYDNKLDANGYGEFLPLITDSRQFKGKLNANFTVRVFEPGGLFSIDRFSMPWLPYSTFVGFKIPQGDSYNGALSVDKDHKVSIAAISDREKPVAGRNIRVSVYKLETQWWWQVNSIRINDYYSSGYSKSFIEDIVSTDANGKASYTLNFQPDEFGAYLMRICDMDGNHCASEVFAVAGDSFNPEGETETKNSKELSLSSDKEEYSTGDNIVLSFPSPAGGKAHISIEDGLGIIEQRWVETKAGNTELILKSNLSYAPNVYAHVTVLQPHKNENDLPLRMYGILRLNVTNPDTKLEPQITCANVFKPEDISSIQVSEKQGKAMEYTLAVVDEGLLGLTRFETPDPWKAMNATEALGINTWDLYDDVIGRYSGMIESEIRIGGGGDAGPAEDNARANRFIPMVRHLGPFKLKAGEKVNHKISIPAYYGSVRVMLVATATKNAWGHAEKSVQVKKPLMLLSTLPRVLSPQEEINLPVSVFALDPSIKNVQVSIKANGMFRINSGSTQTVQFKTPGDALAHFKVQVLNKTGIGKITIQAKSGNQTAISETEIDIRSPNPLITQSEDVILASGESWEKNIECFGMPGTCTASIELSGMPSIDLTSRLNYLTSYPYGCVEQLTSSVFPQVYLTRLLDLNEKDQKKTVAQIKAAISKLALYQNSVGAFSYWPGNSSSDDWASSYTGHFLLEAKLAGYSVNSDMLSSWKRYQNSNADLWKPIVKINKNTFKDDGLLQSYRLYTLALASVPNYGAMNRLKEYPNLSREGAGILAAAYAQSGQREAALTLLYQAESKSSGNYSYWRSYGDPQRDKAVRLWVMAKLKLRKEAMVLAREIAQDLNSSGWYSTQTTSWCLLAMSEFYTNRAAQRIDATITQNGKTERIFTNKSIIKNKVDLDGKSAQLMKLSNPNKSELFVKLIKSGIPGTDRIVDAYSSGMTFKVRFTKASGEAVDITRIPQGTDVEIEVMVSNPTNGKAREDMALNMMMASGWEIENNRVSGMEASVSSDSYTYQDIRDDRVLTYFSLRPAQTKSFRFRFNASYEGRYYLPVWTCEAMYDHSFSAGTSSRWIEIVKSEEEPTVSR
ncbi:MAG: MG2 domain-containing protein [Bacteroidia bacterium]